MILAQVTAAETFIRTTDEVAKHDDRWMFVALLIIGLAAIWFLARYFMREIDRLRKRVDDVHEKFEAHLKSENAEMVSAIARSSHVIEQNSSMLEDLRTVLLNRSA